MGSEMCIRDRTKGTQLLAENEHVSVINQKNDLINDMQVLSKSFPEKMTSITKKLDEFRKSLHITSNVQAKQNIINNFRKQLQDNVLPPVHNQADLTGLLSKRTGQTSNPLLPVGGSVIFPERVRYINGDYFHPEAKTSFIG